jgi:hypothetical protein
MQYTRQVNSNVNLILDSAILYRYTVFRAQADWTLILMSATSCDSAAPLAVKNAAARLQLLARIVYFFR